MLKLAWKSAPLGICFILFAYASFTFSQHQSTKTNLIEGYKKWTRVNKEPATLSDVAAALCSSQASGVPVKPIKTPHDKYIVVYVNDIGKTAMLTQRKPQFPVGTVIVKEKLPSRTSNEPELLTVMVKQKKGFDPKNGDWQYLSFDGKSQKEILNSEIKHCQDCHRKIGSQDYVFRTYLPEKIQKSLR